MSSRKSLLSARWLALAFVAGLAHAAVPQGIDAEREEARLTREYPRLFVADAYLTSILGRIVTAAPDSMVSGVRIRALRDNAPYVFCLGNGAIYVSTGLLARLENDSQVAGIIAPEVASAFAPNGKLQA
jgi:Zn-dependent protease with chaperone function